MREFIAFYVQKTNALQQKKTSLLRQFSFNKNAKRRVFFKQIIIDHSFVDEFESYRQLQNAFFQISFLIHFVFNRQLYIDIDVFKRFNFEIVVYHLKIDCLNSIKSKRINIESILFLNKMLNIVKIKY